MTVAGQDSRGALLPPGVPRRFHLLTKPTGAVCNLDCTCCFFLSKEMLYPGSRFRMADDLVELYLRQLIQAHKGAPEVVVAWQGGEPTMMGPDAAGRRRLKPGSAGITPARVRTPPGASARISRCGRVWHGPRRSWQRRPAMTSATTTPSLCAYASRQNPAAA